MPSLERALRANKTIRVIGFDDAPFSKADSHAVRQKVSVAGIVCAATRFEGMLWGTATVDGDDATDVVASMILQSKFHDQLHLVLIDGIAVGGFNILRLKDLHRLVGIPCVAVMRRQPNMPAIIRALKKFDDAAKRIDDIEQAGEVFQKKGFVFQVQGVQADIAADALALLTDTGKVPEALRMAHLIGAAIITGESSSGA